MTERDFEAFKRAWENYPSQDNEGYRPDRGSFKSGFLAGLAHRDSEINAENARLREALEKATERPHELHCAWLDPGPEACNCLVSIAQAALEGK